MKRALLIAGIVLFLVVVIALGILWQRFSSTGRISFAATHDVGVVVQGEQLEHEFSIHNDRSVDLHVDRVVVSYASTVVSIDSVLPAGGDARLRIKTNTAELRGTLQETARIYFTDPGVDPMWVALEGRIVLPVEIAPRDRVYFFTVKGEGPEREIRVINHQDRPLEILDVASSNPLFKVELREVERRSQFKLDVRLDSAAPVGRHESTITVTTDSPDYPSLDIKALAMVEDIVSTSLSRVAFPKVQFDALDNEVIARKVILVKKHRGQGFEVLRASTDVPFLSVNITPDKTGEGFLVYVKIEQRRATRGTFEGTLVIETNDPDFPEFRLPITGTIL